MPRLPGSVVLLCLVLLGLTACTSDDVAAEGPEAKPGEVLPATFGWDITGHPLALALPFARYTMIVSEPETMLEYSTASELGLTQEAPEGHAFIGVGWRAEGMLGDGWLLAGHNDAPAQVTLSVEGRDYDLGDLRGEQDGAYALVPEQAGDVAVSVEYDGLTQTMDPLSPTRHRGDGPNSLYHEAPGLFWEDCADRRFRTRDDDPANWIGADCAVQRSDPLPYMAELGWAPEGRQWLPVRVSLDNASLGFGAGDDYVSYEVVGDDVRATLEGDSGARAVMRDTLAYDEVEPGVQDDGTWKGLLVFEVDEGFNGGELTLRRRYLATAEESDSGASGAPRLVRRTFAATMPLR